MLAVSQAGPQRPFFLWLQGMAQRWDSLEHTADLCLFNHFGLGRFVLFSGSLLNLILKICLRSLQDRFLIALSLKNVEQN